MAAQTEITVLLVTAASIGFFHTVLGPDHYIPFIAISKARNWSVPKTLWITLICGIGHIGGSIVLGAIGVSLGFAVSSLEFIEAIRGEVAAWLLITFGLLYSAWGIKHMMKKRVGHTHDGEVHTHHHFGQKRKTLKELTPWLLFLIFVFGPCEPLIPVLMYPAAMHNTGALIAATSIFGIVTVGTMLGMVSLSLYGIKIIPQIKLERYSHFIAGLTILLCGLGIQFLGL
ncbi:MAG: sulfite exporter TauE/SafE family protein [Bacteroidales bacterium]|nr:sulfite exporter TauE/SafE family protein [Bacteroidales bacterium]